MHLDKRFFYFLSSAFALSFFLSNSGFSASTSKDMTPWPKAEKNYKRIVINLPARDQETDARLELIPEKTMKVDCNTVLLHGNMDIKTVDGWGYNYYVLNNISAPVSTRMACPEQKLQNKPVHVSINLPFLTYNSKLPVVLYVPKDISLTYRIWTAGVTQTGNEQ